jgi:hypothetical protein
MPDIEKPSQLDDPEDPSSLDGYSTTESSESTVESGGGSEAEDGVLDALYDYDFHNPPYTWGCVAM